MVVKQSLNKEDLGFGVYGNSIEHLLFNSLRLFQLVVSIALVVRYWPAAVSFRDPDLEEWSSEALREAIVWGFTRPVLEWKSQQFSTEKLYAEQLNFWQYPEQDAFERHQRMEALTWDGEGVHLYVVMPWATWIDKKTFSDQLLEAYRSRIRAMAGNDPAGTAAVAQRVPAHPLEGTPASL